jgi:phage shock protein PspC (stress-responsive transcriptional regulator)
MNGTSRLYRSTSEAMLGGVAAGLANYFKIDVTLVRAGFVILTFLSAGWGALIYLAMWLLIPAPGTTATEPGQIVQENINDMGNRFRSLVGASQGPANGGQQNAPNGQNGAPSLNAGNGAPTQAPASTRPGTGPMVLIIIGAVFLLMNLGIFRGIYWGTWWPIFLIGLGVLLLVNRNRR